MSDTEPCPCEEASREDCAKCQDLPVWFFDEPPAVRDAVNDLWKDLAAKQMKIEELEKKLKEVKAWALKFGGDREMRLRKIRLLLYTEEDRG